MKHMTKKLLALLIIAVLLLSLLPLGAYAAEKQGTCGSDLQWVFEEDKETLRISGTGSMTDYPDFNAPWRSFNSKIKTIVIEEGVTTIGAYAFDSSNVSKVEFPSTLVSIGDYAFYWCDELTEVTLPDGLQKIGRNAFYVTEVSKVTIGAGLKELDPTAFAIDSMKTFIVSENNQHFSSDSQGVLYNKAKTRLLHYPAKLTATYVVPNSVTELGAYAFYCVSLFEVTLPSSLEVIGEYCFQGASAGTFVLPASLRSVGENAFAQSRFTAFRVEDGNTRFSTDDAGVLFNKDKTYLIRYPIYREGSYDIPNGVTEIAPYAFSNCQLLPAVTIPEGVKELKDSTFYNSQYLEEVTLPNSLKTIGSSAFDYCIRLKDVTLPGGLTYIGDYAFFGCRAFESIAIPNSVETIGDSAFCYCNSLKAISLPNSLKTMGSNAFNECSSLEEITIPNGVTSIGSWAFADCENLKSITIPGSLTELGYNMFSNCKSLKHVLYTGSKEQWDANKTAWHMTGLTLHSPLIHYGAKGTEAHWVTKGANTYFYCDLCQEALIGTVPATPFTDVSTGIYYYEPVVWAVENNITTGTSATTFSPDKDCTRGQIVTFLWRACGSPEPTNTTHSFTDIQAGAYYYKAVLWAVEEGITTGMTSTTFAPDKTCTRGQAVTFLWRAQGKPTPATTANPFKDVAETDYFYAPVLWASENGITTGTSATTFAPAKTCTRAQIVTFLYRALSEK